MGFFKKIIKGIGKVFSKVFKPVLKLLKKWLLPDVPDKEALLVPRRGSDYAIPVVYGTRQVGGIVVDRNISDSAGGLLNENLHVLVVFCHGEIDGFLEFFFNGIPWTDERFKKNGVNMWTVETRNGTATQNPVNAAGKLNRFSATESHYRGIAHAFFTFTQDPDSTIWNGEPEITATIKGKKCYNPSTLETVYTENPAWHLLDYVKSNVYGLGMADSGIDLNSFIAVGAISDTIETAIVDTQICEVVGGNYICTGVPAELVNFKRFTHNNIIDTGRELFGNVQEIANSFRGFFPDSDGRLKIAAETEGDPVFSFNADNIVSSITSSTPGIRDRFNRVVVRFPNKVNSYEMDEVFYPLTDDPLYQQWLDEDNGLLLERTITAETTVYKAEAMQLAEVAAKASRNAEVVQFTATAEAIQCDIGDIVDITEENRGWISKEFRISEIEYRDDYLVNITAIQHEDAIYPWSDIDYSEIIGGSNLGDPANIAAPVSLALTPDPTLTTSGTLTWSYTQNAFVRRFTVSLAVNRTNYTVAADAAISSTSIVVSPTPAGEQPGAIVTIGNEQYTLQSITPSNIILTSPTTVFYPAGTPFTTNKLSQLDTYETLGQSFVLPLFDIGDYSASVRAVSTIGILSPAATLSFTLAIPVPPTSLSITPSNFEIVIRPVLASVGLGTAFEYAISDTTVIRGRGASFAFVGLSPNTEYTIYVRTVNALGVSAWISETVTTTADATDIVDLIGEDIAAQILPDVVSQVSADLEQVVTDALADYPTTIEVDQIVTDRINEVNAAEAEDPRLPIVAIVEANLKGLENTVAINQETKNRVETVVQLQNEITGTQSTITEVQQVVADLDQAITTDITGLQAQVDGNTAAITETNQTVATLSSSVSTSLLDLQSEVDGNTSGLIVLNQTVVDLDSAVATQVTSLQSQIDGNTASITNTNQTVADLTSATATTVSSLQSQINTNSAAITTTNQTVADLDSATSTSITELQSQVDDNDARITLVNNTSVDRDNAISGQVTTLQATVDDNTAQISIVNSASVDRDNAISTQITTLQSQTEANTASIVATNQTVTNLTSSTATSITALQSQVDDNEAAITITNQTVATLTSSTATSITSLQSQVDDNEAAITTTNQTIATLTTATATQINNLQSQVDDNQAAILTTNQTVADLGSATASQFNSLTATVDDNTANITTTSQALATETSTRATQFDSLSAADAAIITQVNEVEADVEGNSTAITTLQGAVNNPTTGLSASYTLANQAKTTADGAASVANTTAGAVNNSTTGLSASYTLANQAKTTADGASSAVNTLALAVNNPTTGLSATLTIANQAQTTADGAASVANTTAGAVNNSTTGLSATYTLANQAKTTADGAASVSSTVQGQVNNSTTGLSATYTLASQAKTTADGAASSATAITNTVNNPTTGLAATATIANGAKTTADNALSATTGLQTQITSLDGELSAAQLVLSSTVDELGDVSSRAYLGVTSTAGGVSTISGIVVDGATRTLEMRADVFRLSNSAGVNQLYWDAGRAKWVFNGDIVAGLFQTATSGYRAEMSRTGSGTSLPFWYGTGEKLWANASFAVDSAGNVVMRNASLENITASGGLVTGTGTAIRTEVVNDGTYLLWIGSGAKTDVNGLFWIKTNGTGFIKGDFFSGQIIETQMGTSVNTLSVSAPTHNSAGKPVRVTGSVSLNYEVSGNLDGQGATWQLILKRGGTTISSTLFSGIGLYDFEFQRTLFSMSAIGVGVDTLTTAGNRTYSAEIAMVNGAVPDAYNSINMTADTFENKLA
jgi:predicted phage tail protein/uncharacterized membrane-anchored protein YhcB (DUF1043 family)